MKFLFLELWIEHKKTPFISILKIITLLYLFGMGGVIGSFPYTVFALGIVFALQSVSVILYGEIKCFLPQTKQQQAKIQVQKSAFLALIYSMTTVVGYIRNINFAKHYLWDMEIILFLIALFLITFLMLFRYQLFLEQISAKRKTKMIQSRNIKNYIRMMYKEIYAILSALSLLIFICYKFGRIKEFQIFQEVEWKVCGLLFLSAVLFRFMMENYKDVRSALGISKKRESNQT